MNLVDFVYVVTWDDKFQFYGGWTLAALTTLVAWCVTWHLGNKVRNR